MEKPTQSELCELFADFVNTHGIWPQFEAFIKEKGYTLNDIVFSGE